MEEDPVELIKDAINNLTVLTDEIADDDIILELESTIELLEDAERSLEVTSEMTDMMNDYEDNMEGLE